MTTAGDEDGRSLPGVKDREGLLTLDRSTGLGRDRDESFESLSRLGLLPRSLVEPRSPVDPRSMVVPRSAELPVSEPRSRPEEVSPTRERLPAPEESSCWRDRDRS